MLHLYLTDSFLLDKKIVCCCILHPTKNTEVNFLSGSELFKDEPHIHENLWSHSFVGRPSISSHFFIYFVSRFCEENISYCPNHQVTQ